jgi:hypothetical protein
MLVRVMIDKFRVNDPDSRTSKKLFIKFDETLALGSSSTLKYLYRQLNQ